MFSGPIHETVDILMDVKRRGYPVYTLSNWNDKNLWWLLKSFRFWDCLTDGLSPAKSNWQNLIRQSINYSLKATGLIRAKHYSLMTFQKYSSSPRLGV